MFLAHWLLFYLIGFFVTVIYKSPFSKVDKIQHQRHERNAAFRSTVTVLKLHADLVRDLNVVTEGTNSSKQQNNNQSIADQIV